MKFNDIKLLCLGLTTVAILSGCSGSGNEEKSSNPPVADIVTVKAEDVVLEQNLPGRLEAFREAVIIPRVNGIVLKRLYEEGSIVKEGQSLYKLDDGTYLSALKNAQADLQQAEANKTLYQLTVNRYKPLLKSKAVSRQVYDQAVANLKAQEAAIASAQAAIDTAKTNLDYTDIKAPITGRVGYSQVTEGAYVTASQTEMATIQQLSPLYINITQSASDVLKIKQATHQGEVDADVDNHLKLLLADGSEYPYEGNILFTNQWVNESTGEVTVRATIDNPDGALIPGLYVRVVLPQGVFKKAFLVPQQAITRSDNNVLFVVNKDGTIAPKIVGIADSKDNNWIVTTGLEEGDKVIVDGIIPIMMAKSKLPADQQDTLKVETRQWINPLVQAAKKSTDDSDKQSVDTQ